MKNAFIVPGIAIAVALMMWAAAAFIFFDDRRPAGIPPEHREFAAQLALPGMARNPGPADTAAHVVDAPDGEIATDTAPAVGLATASDADTRSEADHIRTIDPAAVMAVLDRESGLPTRPVPAAPGAADTSAPPVAAADPPSPAAMVEQPASTTPQTALVAPQQPETASPQTGAPASPPTAAPAVGRSLTPTPGTGLTADGSIVFGWPVDCTIDDDCYIQQYVDHDPTEGYMDYRCGPLSYDTHKGTDIRVPSIAAMEEGVGVLAAAAGVVSAIREGMPDVHMRLVGREAVNDRGLGNVVVLDHPGGWRSIYAHLRRSSVRVQKGDRVEAGQFLGLVGLSGLTEFPHLHFGVMRNGRAIDPFIGDVPMEGCDMQGRPLWAPELMAPLAYRETFITAAGFYNHKLRREALLYGLADDKTLSRNIANLFFFVDLSGLHAGDQTRVQFFGPGDRPLPGGGSTIENRTDVNFRTYRVPRTVQDGPWQAGTYRAVFQLFRGEGETRREMVKLERSIELQ